MSSRTRSPINYLILIGKVDLLKQLKTRIVVLPAVLAELKHPLAPKPVRDWAVNAPAWVEVLSLKSNVILGQLDLGEIEAIALAAEMHADVLLMDEQAGRQEAIRRGIRVAGTLSVLDEAEQTGLVDFDNAVAELQKNQLPHFARCACRDQGKAVSLTETRISTTLSTYRRRNERYTDSPNGEGVSLFRRACAARSRPLAWH